MKTPYISDELIEFLDKMYPERTPETSWTDREIWVKVGERKVVRKLKQMAEDQIQREMIKSK